MTDGTDGNKRQVKPRSRQERARRGVANFMENPRFAGIRSWLDVAIIRLEALEQKIPAPLKTPKARKWIVGSVIVLGGIGALRVAA
ncbi:MAG: penicillin-binding protein, partial [Leptolyngbya sp. ERB_1_2]